jgi:protein TonB
MKKNTRLIDLLTDEISQRPILGLLTVLVILMHLWVVLKLLEPTEEDKPTQQMKIIEVALVEVKPKAESPAPAPAKATPPKKEPPKKKVVEPPPVKKKAPVVHKLGEILKPKTVTKETTPPMPVITAPMATKKDASSTNPALFSNKAASKAAANTGSGNTQGGNSGVVELGCPKPKYPMRAMSRHIEGWVKIEMTIDTDGRVSNASVAGSEPPGIFDEAALAAIKNCKFKPKMVNGKAVAQRGVKKSSFKLTN